MSAISEKPQTLTQRATNAADQLRDFFGFDNLKAMNTAIAEAAVVEARNDPAFAQRVRAIYYDLSQNQPRRSSGERRERPLRRTRSTLKPLGAVEGYDLDPLAPLDPYFYLKLYGAEQFPLALDEQTLARLKVAAKKLMADNPGTKPKSLASKADVIDYIVAIVTGKR